MARLNKLFNSPPWKNKKNVYVSSLLTSSRPRLMPRVLWLHINRVMSYLCAKRAINGLCQRGYNVIYPGNHDKLLRELPGYSNWKRRYGTEILDYWKKVIAEDVDVLIAGWRCEASKGATEEVEQALKLGIPVFDLRGQEVTRPIEWTGYVH